MPKRTKSYESGLMERLKDPRYAAGYLNSVLEDNKDKGLEERFLIALRDVAKAYGLSHLSSGAKLNRQSLYRALSDEGNPELSTLTALLKAMGLRLAVETAEPTKKAS
jgi:probable addiction module antidote protein